MYAVIQAGGKQQRVSPGELVRVELSGSVDAELVLPAVLVVDGSRVLATREELEGVAVNARVVGEELGPKIRGFTYRPKSRYRRRWGHRQHYSTVEITGIEVPAAR